MTAKADSWPVDLDREFWRICGIFEKSERGRVVICNKARVRNEIVYNTAPVTRPRREAITIDCDFELRLRVKELLGKYTMMRKVMRTF